MKPLVDKLKPARGYAHIAQIGLTLLLPLILLAVLHINYVGLVLALALVVLSKWRMFAVRPRFWLTMVRANAVDIMVGVSAVLFMDLALDQIWLQLLMAAFYAVWLLAVKPGSKIIEVALQALIGQLAGLLALFLIWPDGPLYGLVALTALITFISARHFFDGFDEPYSRMLAYLWAYFSAALVWVLGHWLLFYLGFIAQPVVVLTTVGYGLAVLYYYDHHNKLTPLLRRQMLIIMSVVLLVVIIWSDWGDKVV